MVGWAKLSLGENKQAKKYLKKAIELDPSFASPYLNMGIIEKNEMNVEVARQYLIKAQALGQNTETGKLATNKIREL